MTLMACSQNIQQRAEALFYGDAAQSPRFGNSGRQQTDTADNHQFPALSGGKGEAEHPAQVFDADHFGREHIRYANRIDEVGTHVSPNPGVMPDRAACIHIRVCSTAHNLKNESKQAVSGCYPPVSTNVVDGLRGHESKIGAAS